MKIAILSVSKKGKFLSKKLKFLLDNDPTIIRVSIFHKNVKKNIKDIFNDYDAIIGIMASGIIIRSVCENITTKYNDPAILSIDENGKFVISLLSGHFGGANKLTTKIANLLSAQEVITTSTDVNRKIGIDTLANHFYWDLIDKKEVLTFNKAILKNKTIYLISFSKNINYINYFLKDNTLEIIDSKEEDVFIKIIRYNNSCNKNTDSKFLNNIFSSYNRNSDNIIAYFNNHKIELRPKKLVVGIGSKKNISKETVLFAIETAMNNLNLPIDRIDYLTTGIMKKDENGILQSSNILKKPLKVVEKEKLKEFYNNDNLSQDCSKSDFVKERFGIEGVCEASAIIVAGEGSKLIHKKIARGGVTVAIAISK